jgi:Glycosyl hydrolases family 16
MTSPPVNSFQWHLHLEPLIDALQVAKMPPKETDSLILPSSSSPVEHDDRYTTTATTTTRHHGIDRTMQIRITSFDEDGQSSKRKLRIGSDEAGGGRTEWWWIACGIVTCLAVVAAACGGLVRYGLARMPGHHHHGRHHQQTLPSNQTLTCRTGPYQLSEVHQGANFINFYDFYEGADSLGSAGYNTYASSDRAAAMGLVSHGSEPEESLTFTMRSIPTTTGPRESVRLEGRTHFDAGLFLLDLDHMPTGCGQWPAFWLTDEDHWPDHGEIDILEGVNYQAHAKTALHTSSMCSQYAHVPAYRMTGTWDRATGIPDTFTGHMDFATSVPADNCWTMAPHQWANQGCVVQSADAATLGRGLNEQGGGIFALQWDPENRYIRSWVFPKDQGIPNNLQQSLDSASRRRQQLEKHEPIVVTAPDPDTWGLPYAYFAIGETTGCSADHFSNMRIVFNTAFCGTVAGNRFFTDCPDQAARFNISNDPVQSCNAWIASNPTEMDEAYWTIQGVYVYERAWEETKVADNDTKI